jgi:endoglucanase
MTTRRKPFGRVGLVFPTAVAAMTTYLATTHSIARAAGTAFVRVNQVGYLPHETKRAVLMASASEHGATVKVVNTSTGHTVYQFALSAGHGTWSDAYHYTYALDFSTITAVGTHEIEVTGPISADSPRFRIDIGPHLYAGLLPNARFFYKAQRDGPDVDPAVMDRQPSHLKDEAASIYATPIYDNDVLQGSLKKIGGKGA